MVSPVIPAPIVVQSAIAIDPPTINTNMQQSLDKDAFEVALTDADQRRTMGDTDLVVTASVDTLRALSMDSYLTTDQLYTEHSHSQLSVRESTPSVPYQSLLPVVHGLDSSAIKAGAVTCGAGQYDISGDVLSVLRQRLSSPTLPVGETLSIALVDSPSGVLGIDLTKTENHDWEIDVLLANNDGLVLSAELAHTLRQNGFSIACVSIEVAGS